MLKSQGRLQIKGVSYWIMTVQNHRFCQNKEDFFGGIKTQTPQTTYKSHYSKSQIFVQKINFDETTTFSRVFHPKFFRQFLS